ncbi:organic hydroperoxide resistance protein [Plasticicumulans sp.]|uniref:organic hydroperoxide resistance protein n=1 Tax=Plasticicumulans sp. TaxID=2307179 RepID=UPI002CD65778|nr:organic hydroperoxide resistance protein [Plasticicumulans sp.]MBS0603290.1 organic hydroperoxide resistance protein [Pseudomonadota bacterium]HMV39647.1 organic hydroperoxide resistance protein [Plasticicumulans sp.]HMW29498.1 organic hydroperoxide resistance protein [Plasticicumulans sp.]HMW42172.1 organic hydroperoxide resistance protein [Plasticicumulans sp.]HMX53537.1 organic hydroperoxide resistance protein [Plasticicumulans sp.]
MNVLYRTEATATGGRTGTARTADGAFEVRLVTPKELGGPGGSGNNPEQLFAAGYSACFLGAIKFVAGQKKVKIAEDSTVTAQVGIGPRDDGQGFGLDVALSIDLPGLDRETAEAIVQQAHIVCPYSHATRGSLDVRLSLK